MFFLGIHLVQKRHILDFQNGQAVAQKMDKSELEVQATSVWRDGSLFFGYDINSWKRYAIFAIVLSAGMATIVTALDPTSTAELSFAKAVLLWFLHIIIAINLMTAVVVVSILLRAPQMVANVLAVILLPFLLAPISLFLDWVLDAEEKMETPQGPLVEQYLNEVMNIAPSSLALAALVFVFVLRAAKLSQALRLQISRMNTSKPLLRKAIPGMSANLGDDLIRIEVQDHYILVVTSEGQVMLNATLTECVGKLGPFDGTQCHRSHWVAHKHIQKLKKNGSAYLAVMKNGDEVPVSRRRYRDLRTSI